MNHQPLKWQTMARERNTSIQIARRYRATCERVFDAWVDPKIARQWLFASPLSAEDDFELDVRVGGRWKIADPSNRRELTAVGEYVAVERPRRLVFTFAMPQFSAEHDRVTVEIAPDGEDGCVLALTEEGISPGYERSSRNGWGGMLDDLAAALS